jgi:hypothetical protein
MSKKIETYKHTDLKKYGLNPFHWFISEWNSANPKLAFFTHIDDHELQLEATLTKESNAQEYSISELAFFNK